LSSHVTAKLLLLLLLLLPVAGRSRCCRCCRGGAAHTAGQQDAVATAVLACALRVLRDCM
jgi:hypothetical protein